MRIESLGIQNSINNRKSSPSFGMTFVQNIAADNLMKTFKDYGARKHEVKDTFSKLDKEIDGSITLSIDETRPLYSDEEHTQNYATKVYGTLSNGISSKHFISYIANDSLKQSRDLEGLYQTIKTAANSVGAVRTDAKSTLNKMIDSEYSKVSYSNNYEYDNNDI